MAPRTATDRSIAPTPIARAAAALAIVLAAVLVVAYARELATPAADALVTFRPVQRPDAGYVSSDTCRACHPSQYQSWRGSFHRTMTQVASAATIRADFTGAAAAPAPVRFSRDGDRFSAEFDDPDWSGAPADAPRITRPIVMVTGSHQQQVYWYRSGRGRLLGQLPVMYLVNDRRWVPRRAAFLRPADGRALSETGRWNAVCIDCHATRGTPGFDRPVDARSILDARPDTHAAEFGVACEACHGPAERHAAGNRNPLRRYALHFAGSGDATVVQPRRLSARISSDVCGQCHSVWTFADPAAKTRANTVGLSYRPGDDLRQTRLVVDPSTGSGRAAVSGLLSRYPGLLRDSFWSDGMIRVSGREYNGLIASPCFKNAASDDRRLTCFSCHAMHLPAGDGRSVAEWADRHQLGADMDGNGGCLQCHQRIAGDVAAHTRHRDGSSGSACYNCHMPYTTYGLLRALRSHQVSSPSVAASVETGRPNACNLCHLDKTLAWTADQLRTMYGIDSPALGDDERTVAASVLWLLRGDAGQRALTAWSLGWQPAQEASGTAWMAPYLSLLLDDPYDAVRSIAARSLRSLPGFESFAYDFMGDAATRRGDGVRAMERWRRFRLPLGDRPALLFGPRGLRQDEWTRLVRLRDDRPLSLAE